MQEVCNRDPTTQVLGRTFQAIQLIQAYHLQCNLGGFYGGSVMYCLLGEGVGSVYLSPQVYGESECRGIRGGKFDCFIHITPLCDLVNI